MKVPTSPVSQANLCQVTIRGKRYLWISEKMLRALAGTKDREAA